MAGIFDGWDYLVKIFGVGRGEDYLQEYSISIERQFEETTRAAGEYLLHRVVGPKVLIAI